MKTIYLKSLNKLSLIADINKVIEDYSNEIESNSGEIHVHYIGQIPKTKNQETGEVIEWINGYHANVLVPDNFDESIFDTLVIPPPDNPVHQFA